MIRVILQGRTGNNLFQYAAGRALAEHHQVPLLLDGAWVKPDQARIFEHLLKLPIKASYENRYSAAKRISRKLFGINPASFHKGTVILDPGNGILPNLKNSDTDSLLIGFFQSPLHFGEIEENLRRELDLSVLRLPDDSIRFEDSLRNKLTASIHVRRGDYLGISETHCIGKSYHTKSIDLLRKQYEGIRFCVFSDDIPWCRNQFQGSDFLFCDFHAASRDPFHDMRLMSACCHHIIVNSSYSWWGAWLNESPVKTVIAPKMWMSGLSASSITPTSWIRL